MRSFSLKLFLINGGTLRTIKNLPQPAFQEVRHRVHTLAFSKDDHYPGLQVADMIAYEARNLMVKRIEDKDAPSSPLYTDLTHGGCTSRNC